MRVPQYLHDQEVRFEALVHPPAFTAQRRARRLHLSGRALAKCVLLAARHYYFLAILPATHRVELEALTGLYGVKPRLASEEEIATVFRDCEWGVVTPFGRLYGIPTVLDSCIHPDSWLVFEAHFHHLTLRIRCADFERLERPRRISFARRVE
jgi:Ala-tRNA(Pro) deacylase